MNNNHYLGRPTLSSDEIDAIFRKLEPYLRSGLSVNKACLQAQIPKSTVYDLYTENSQFAEKVEAAKNYSSVLINNILIKELSRIAVKQKEDRKLTQQDIKLVQWLAVNSKSTQEEFGRQIEINQKDSLEEKKQDAFNILQDPKAFEIMFRVHNIAVQRMNEKAESIRHPEAQTL